MRPVRLLVAEDDRHMSDLLRRGLSREGYAVDVVDNGPEAVWLASEVSYGAIVLDVMLPGYDGFAVCRDLRAKRRGTPVLMLTARDAVADRVEGLDAGADDYLIKPFSFAELNARLRALIRSAPPGRPAVLAAGALRLDPGLGRAWRGDHELHLSAREFGLLEVFLRNPGIVLSRAQLLQNAWEPGFRATSNIVDQYVRYLRDKIDRPFGRSDLETVRGLGYRLRDPASG